MHANFLDRHAMVSLALAGRPNLVPSSMEYDRTGKSYTIDTLRQFKSLFPAEVEVFFLIGLDAFMDIRSWKDYLLLPDLANFILFTRQGYSLDALKNRLPAAFVEKLTFLADSPQEGTYEENRIFILDDFSCDISSTAVRERIQAGQPVPDWLPATVEEYIQKTGIYLRANCTTKGRTGSPNRPHFIPRQKGRF
jgi:nicotinate-nucleotide adenylyltransferase